MMSQAHELSASGGCRIGGGIKSRIIEDFDELIPMRDEWNRLAERAYTNTVFQSYEFHASWWRAYGSGCRLQVILIENDRVLAGIGPLMIRSHRVFGLNVRVVQFIGARHFDYADFIIDRCQPHILTSMLNALSDTVLSWDLIYLRDIPGESMTLPALGRFFTGRGRKLDVRVLYEAPTRVFNNPVEDRQLPNKKSLKRHYNYFQRSGRLECINYTSAEQIVPLLECFFEQHIRRRAGTDSPSIFRDERARMFFHELTRALTPKGWLVFSVVSFNGQLVAMHFGFEYANRLTWYKPSFDISYARHSPGEVLIKFLLEYALARKVQELDFTIGAEPFKHRFANHVRSNYGVRVFRHRFAHFVNRLLLDVRELIERHARLRSAARRMLRPWRDQPWF